MSPYTALLERPTAQPAAHDVPGLVHVPRAASQDVLAAGRAVALLAAHARRGLVSADGPIDDDQVVRAAAYLLRDHQPWAARG